jgi:hypothetical protein
MVYTRIQCIYITGFKNEGSFYELALAPVAYNSSTRTRTHVVLLL